MATQVTNVYIKKKNDTEWTELEKVYEGDVLKFQKSPVKDAYYDYTRIAMVMTVLANPYYTVKNTSNYTINVTFTNGVVNVFTPGKSETYLTTVLPAKVKIGDNPIVALVGDGVNTWYNNNVPYKYHPAEYMRELYVK